MKLSPLLLSVTLLGLLAQTAPGACAQSGSAPKPGSIQGAVVNSATGAPIGSATVSLAAIVPAGSPSYSRLAATDQAGKFEIDNVEPGFYRVDYIHAQGYVYQPPPGSALSGQVVVAEGQHVTDITLEMLPLGAISGTVTDENGEPLQDVQVAVMAYGYSDGSKSLQIADGATTDDRGAYRVFNLWPGNYFVHAWWPPGRPQRALPPTEPLPPNLHRDTPETGFVPAFYPNASDVSQATPVRLAPGGQVSGIDLRLRSVPVFDIRGDVQGPARGKPAFRLVAAPCPESAAGAGTGAASYSTEVQADGRFEFAGAAPGVYCLTLVQLSQPQTAYGNRTVTVADHDLDGVTLMSMPAFSIPGTVKLDAPSSEPLKIWVNLEADFVLRTGPFMVQAQPKDGVFTLTGVLPGTYHVTAFQLPPTMYLKSIQYGPDDVSGGLVHIGAEGPALTLVLGTDAGQLSGTVLTASNLPAARVPVTIVPPDRWLNRRDLFKTVRTDSSGQFQVIGLAPGEYKIYAWGDPDVPMATGTRFPQGILRTCHASDDFRLRACDGESGSDPGGRHPQGEREVLSAACTSHGNRRGIDSLARRGLARRAIRRWRRRQSGLGIRRFSGPSSLRPAARRGSIGRHRARGPRQLPHGSR